MLPHVRACAVFATALYLLAPSAMPAQQSQYKPDCNLAERRFDNPVADHSGWWMRRYQWHAFYAITSTVAAEGIHRVTHLPRWASAVTAAVVLGVAPHVRSSLLTRQYPVDPLDWGFDAFNRAAPIFVWSGLSGGSWRSKTLAAATYAVGYASLACYASP